MEYALQTSIVEKARRERAKMIRGWVEHLFSRPE